MRIDQHWHRWRQWRGSNQSQSTRTADGCLLPDPNATLDEVTKRSYQELGEAPSNAGYGSAADALWAAVPAGGTVKVVEFVCPELIKQAATGDAEAPNRPYNEVYLAFGACLATDPASLGSNMAASSAGAENLKKMFRENRDRKVTEMGSAGAVPEAIAAGKFLCPQNFN